MNLTYDFVEICGADSTKDYVKLPDVAVNLEENVKTNGRTQDIWGRLYKFADEGGVN